MSVIEIVLNLFFFFFLTRHSVPSPYSPENICKHLRVFWGDFFFGLFRATLTAYGGAQVRGAMRA